MEIRRRSTEIHLGPTPLPAIIPSSTAVRLTHQQLSLRHREPWRPGMALLHSGHTESPRSRCLLRMLTSYLVPQIKGGSITYTAYSSTASSMKLSQSRTPTPVLIWLCYGLMPVSTP